MNLSNIRFFLQGLFIRIASMNKNPKDIENI